MLKFVLVSLCLTALFAAALSGQTPDPLRLLGQPVQSEIEPTGFRLSWKTNLPAGAVLTYSSTGSGSGTPVVVAQPSDSQSVTLANLQPGSIYWIRVAAVQNQDTVYSRVLPFATRSSSSGQIKVYFNQGYDAAAANGLTPDGDTYADVLAETLARINSATQSIDVAMYNTSRNDLVFALTQAHNRGVRVRYIAAAATDNNALKPNPVFPVLYGNTEALMHNKFLVIDADLPESAWVMSGSMNWTISNMIQDFNNTLFIQDQSLARTYELEFEEMWGSDGPLPNPVAARFGSQKTDNTPHQFLIGGRLVGCYFSPSDSVTDKIVRAVESTDYQASFAVFSFTKNELGNALIAVKNKGKWVRGFIENINDPGAEYDWLSNNGVAVQAHPASPLLHHKYVVVDANYPDVDPVVVTGSHNWTQSAESRNDENTLFLYDNDLSTLFQAEFERRWWETGTATVTLPDARLRVFPNPVRDCLFLDSEDDAPWKGHVHIRDASGRLLFSAAVEGPRARLDLPDLPAGIYFAQLSTQRGLASFSFQALPD